MSRYKNPNLVPQGVADLIRKLERQVKVLRQAAEIAQNKLWNAPRDVTNVESARQHLAEALREVSK